jgi:hypothetical protein
VKQKNKLIYLLGLAIVFGLIISIITIFNGEKLSSKTIQEPFFESDWTLVLYPNNIKETLVTQNDSLLLFPALPVAFNWLENSGINPEKAWTAYFSVEEQAIYLVLPIQDSVIFDQRITAFLDKDLQTETTDWKVLNGSSFSEKRIKEFAFIRWCKSPEKLPQNIQWKTTVSKSQKNSTLRLSASNDYLKKNNFSRFECVVTTNLPLEANLYMTSTNNSLPAIKPTAWKKNDEKDENFLTVSFNPLIFKEFILQNFSHEIDWMNPRAFNLTTSFLNAWNGDLYVLLGKKETETQQQVVTEMDENFQTVERIVATKIDFLNNVFALSVNDKWSSFENVLTSPAPKVEENKVEIPTTTTNPSIIPPMNFQTEKKSEKIDFTQLNLSKTDGFVALHGSPNTPHFSLSTPQKKLTIMSIFELSIEETSAKKWHIKLQIKE